MDVYNKLLFYKLGMFKTAVFNEANSSILAEEGSLSAVELEETLKEFE